MSRTILFSISTCLTFILVINAKEVSDKVRSEVSSENPRNDTDRSSAYAHASASAKGRGRPTVPPYFPVECHICTDCPEITDLTPSKICPDTPDPGRSGKCVVYAEKYIHMNRPWVIRGCASERGSCYDIAQAHKIYPEIVSLVYCNECHGEQCNTNGASTIAECTIAVITLIIMPVVSKFTLT